MARSDPEQRPVYRVLLVDDEPIILRSLRAAIPWTELRLEIAGEARGGEAALELAASVRPDLIISDIRMPGLDGIALMREVMRERPELVFLVISGYGEFDYAREALRQGAFDYLLKPIDHDELEGMLARAVARLDDRRLQRQMDERLRHSVQALSLLARERLYAELIEGNPAPLRQMQWLEHSELEQPYFMALVQLDRLMVLARRWAAGEQRLWFFAVRNIVEEWAQGSGAITVFPFHSGEWVLLLPARPGGRKTALAEELLGHLERCTKLRYSVGLSGDACGMERLGAAYESCRRALRERFSRSGAGVYADPGAEPTASETRYPKALERELVEAARMLDERRLAGLLARLRAEFGRALLPQETAQRYMSELAILVHRQLADWSPAVEGAAEPLLRQLDEASTLEEMLDAAARTFSSWVAAASVGPPREDAAALIERAQQYIAVRYHEDLGIDELSELVELSTSRFCALFKQETGLTFLEYLTRCRIAKAKALLRQTEVKVYRIAPLVGYQDPKYFTQVFKKLTGLTPTEYREQGESEPAALAGSDKGGVTPHFEVTAEGTRGKEAGRGAK
ncbi:response regulator [Paenibacillus sp. IB182496]|uniref:Response regulator n=1 Tax=Paenibacillus sabuli TaxID=2772509 RepID=A0A927GST0_9BACL|nr:response regulator [Paenibacillus sabuli]MBD2846888.1 response regulator [Paenibacillus sabuli]